MKLYDINTIQSEMRVAGSHWWDRDTMRFFGTRVCGSVFQGDSGIFFVTSERPPHGPRAYTVRKYDPESKDISTYGELLEYKSRAGAISAARRSAGDNCRADGSEHIPVSLAEQFRSDCQTHGNPKATWDACNRLRSAAKRHHRYMEEICNGREMYDDNYEPLPPLRRNRQVILSLARQVGATSVKFSGDPRGCTVKLIFPDGATNDWGKEGWCVPTE